MQNVISERQKQDDYINFVIVLVSNTKSTRILIQTTSVKILLKTIFNVQMQRK